MAVLTHCWKAGGGLAGFTEKTHRTLVHLLDERNAYAHANFRSATFAKAIAYCEKVVDVLTEAPFL